MPIANVALTDTFDEWRVKTNQLIVQSDTLVINVADVSGRLNVSSNTANSGFLTANAGFGVANTASSTSVAAFGVANTASSTSVAAFGVANNGFSTANSGFGQANTARNTANSAFLAANSGFGQANTGYTQANNAFLTANAAFGVANTASTTSVSAFGVANTASSTSVAAFGVANTASSTSVAAFGQANTARTQGNTAFTQANTAYTQANNAFSTANAGFGVANTGFNVANSGFTQANNAYTTANNAFARANNALPASGGTVSGNLILNSNLGVGTASPAERLHVNGNMRLGEPSGNSSYISFSGTYGDGGGNHTYIGERLYAGGESSELLLFKGNDLQGPSGPDRVRVLAGEFEVDTFSGSLAGTFEAVGTATATSRFVVKSDGRVGIGAYNPEASVDIQNNSDGWSTLRNANWSTGASSASVLTLHSGNRYVNFIMHQAGNYLHINNSNTVAEFYCDFITHIFRNNASQNKLILWDNGRITGSGTFGVSRWFNGHGDRFISTAAPSGGQDGDIWYQV